MFGGLNLYYAAMLVIRNGLYYYGEAFDQLYTVGILLSFSYLMYNVTAV